MQNTHTAHTIYGVTALWTEPERRDTDTVEITVTAWNALVAKLEGKLDRDEDHERAEYLRLRAKFEPNE